MTATSSDSDHTLAPGEPEGPANASEEASPELKKKRRGMKIALGVVGAVAALAAAAVVGGIVAGGDNGTVGTTTEPAASDVSESSISAPTQAPDLIGTWKQSNAASEDSYQQATITADTITIEWVSDGGDTTAIYWVGTFDAPTDASEPYTWVSERDAAATDYAILASTSDTKEFTYDGETISYKVSALGTTTTVELTKTD